MKTKFKRNFPHLHAFDVERVFTGLSNYFEICKAANREMVGMPSKIVDEAWHQFILFTNEYAAFCNKAFGYFLHHTPAEAMRSPKQKKTGLKRTWKLSCILEKIDVDNPHKLPLIFSLDKDLNVDNGFHYTLIETPDDTGKNLPAIDGFYIECSSCESYEFKKPGGSRGFLVKSNRGSCGGSSCGGGCGCGCGG